MERPGLPAEPPQKGATGVPCRGAVTGTCCLRPPRVWTQKILAFCELRLGPLARDGSCHRRCLWSLFQCANPLVELTSQEDCCGSVGTFWGVTSCTPCPPRPGEYWCQGGGLGGSAPSPHLSKARQYFHMYLKEPLSPSAQQLGLCSIRQSLWGFHFYRLYRNPGSDGPFHPVTYTHASAPGT